MENLKFHISDDVPNLTPEKYASFLSRILFAWFDRMNLAGWKRLLTYTDLWSLTKENRCSGVVPIWDKYWSRHEEKQQTSAKGYIDSFTLITKGTRKISCKY